MTATSLNWRAQRTDAAALRILDAAEALYATHGVDGVTMRDLAVAAGCSRATLYRYFPSREAVQAAFVDRSADRLAHEVDAAGSAGDPGDRLVAAVTVALRLVRGNPAFANWFRSDGVATAAQLAVVSPAIESLARGFVAGLRGAEPAGAVSGSDAERARWLVRVMLSLLTTPGTDPDDEAQMLRTFVVPVVVG
jgi:AcrR family transcriptional regulator